MFRGDIMQVNTSKCTILSNLSRQDLEILIERIKMEEFPFRNNLNFPTLYTFGNEVEFNCFFANYVNDFLKTFNDRHFLFEDDRYESRTEATASGEIVTPILTNEPWNWITFRDLFDSLREDGATISDNTAGHIHIGTHMINTPQELALLIKTLVVFEPIIFKFGYGYSDKPRSFIEAEYGHTNFAMISTPLKVKRFVDVLEHFDKSRPEEMIQEFMAFSTIKKRYRKAFNFNRFDFRKLITGAVKDTPSMYDNIEIRSFNGTLMPEIAQNNINLIVSIVRAVHEGKIDEKYVQRQYLSYLKNTYNFDHSSSILYDCDEIDEYNRVLKSFDVINLDKAIRLADMIFDDERDKLLFLKQYLKLFDACKKEFKVHL
jgi:hypothetical protein